MGAMNTEVLIEKLEDIAVKYRFKGQSYIGLDSSLDAYYQGKEHGLNEAVDLIKALENDDQA